MPPGGIFDFWKVVGDLHKLPGGQSSPPAPAARPERSDAAGMKAAIISEIEARRAVAAPSPVSAVVQTIDPTLTTPDATAFAPDMRPMAHVHDGR